MHTIITAVSRQSKLKVYISNKEGARKGCQNVHLDLRVHLVDARRITCRLHSSPVVSRHPDPVIVMLNANSCQHISVSTTEANWILMGYISNSNICKYSR